MKAAFDRNYVKRLDGPHVKKAKNKYDLALEIKDDIARFRKKSKASRLVVIWCGSTEIFLTPHEVHSTAAKFEAAHEEKSSRHRALDALRLGGDHLGRALCQWRAESHRGYSGDAGAGARSTTCRFAARTSRPARRC